MATSPAVLVISLLVGLLTILHSSGFQRMRIPSRRLVNQGMKSVNGRLFSEFGESNPDGFAARRWDDPDVMLLADLTVVPIP